MKGDRSYQEDWEDEAPRLASLPKKRPEGVPDGYFERFPTEMMARLRGLDAEGKEEAVEVVVEESVRPLWRRARVWAVAASLVLVASTVFILSRKKEMLTPTEPTADAAAVELKIKLAGLEDAVLAEGIDLDGLSDEDLYAALDAEGRASLDMAHHVGKTDAAEYLQDVALDELEGLDLDQLSDLNF